MVVDGPVSQQPHCGGGSDTGSSQIALLTESASAPRWKGGNAVPSLQWPVIDLGSVFTCRAACICFGKWVSIHVSPLGLVLWGHKALISKWPSTGKVLMGLVRLSGQRHAMADGIKVDI